nr:MAG TPA: hypothetical protein [Caudoviricetes sp.]
MNVVKLYYYSTMTRIYPFSFNYRNITSFYFVTKKRMPCF